MRKRREFKVYQYRRRSREAEFGKILVFYVQLNRLTNICSEFVECISLRYDRHAHTLCDIAAVALRDLKLDNAFHAR